MIATQTPPDPDPLALLASLSSDDIRRQLHDLDDKRRGLTALLRAACARERRERSRATPAPAPPGGPHRAA